MTSRWMTYCGLIVGTMSALALLKFSEARAADDGVNGASQDAAADDRHDSAFDQSRLVRELMRRRGGDPAAAAQLIQLTREFEPAVAAELFDSLADAHVAANNLDLAAETRRLLVQQYPDQPRGRAAKLWLVRLYASSEVALAHRQAAGSESRAGDDGAVDQGLALYALNLANSAAGPTAAKDSDPALVFQRSVAARRAGLQKAADGFLTTLKHGRAGNPWGDCARAEAWLKDPHDAPSPKPIAHCIAAAERPRLDGVLDDACWQTDARLRLSAAGKDPTTDFAAALVSLAYDQVYLYLAVACPKFTGVAYPLDSRPRPHDGDLTANDRVRLLLDADRDYATWFELTVDSRGWTGDRCWEDSAWNPEWFVAAANRADSPETPWVIEAAIPWSALAARPPRPGEAWACAVEREAPGIKPQAWLSPASDPERFGLLLFGGLPATENNAATPLAPGP
jgi:hypothetical protein